jgi:XTP/dITP diphosphohydrolase
LRIKTSFPRGKVAFFVTSNVHKFMEARLVFAEYTIAVALLRVAIHELQNDNIETIAKASAREAAKKTQLPVIVEDTGLFIPALNGFPGPYSNYVYRSIGTRGTLKIMKGTSQRTAYFRSIVAYCDQKGFLKCFEGKAEGKIPQKERGSSGFGFDPIFAPLSSNGKTFAEMTTKEKNEHSHRAKAFRKFARWYSSAFRRRF